MALRNAPMPTPASVSEGRLRVCMMVTYDMASPGGGVKQHALHLAASLRRLGDDVMLVGPSSVPTDDPDVHSFGGIVNIPANGSDNNLGLLVSPRAIARFFREHHFDVIHIHEPLQPALSYWSVWLTRRVPHVATFHAFMEEEGLLLRWARKAWGATMFPWIQRAIAVSEPAARYAREAWNRELSIIPNGVPTDIFTPLKHHDHHHDHHHHHGRVKLLFVGRIGDVRKGARYLFEAYAALVASGLPVTLDVVGELGQAEPPPPLPGLTYHGAVAFDGLAALYRNCDVFVAPSTGQESFGIVLLEAMASAKPVVCSDIEGYRQVATTEGSTLVSPSDAGALADALARVVRTDPEIRRRHGELNRRHAETYDYDRLAERVRHEYRLAITACRASAADAALRVEPAARPIRQVRSVGSED
ncbi:MAG TPA: glycosyltransferase family 4 protein [Kofleriaceae bacterium]|jgi:phosphatidylinositol alpha-mannosyltransferase|nr:glycosyltransferase family 4 protein [Kofleriaceae bacterium]